MAVVLHHRLAVKTKPKHGGEVRDGGNGLVYDKDRCDGDIRKDFSGFLNDHEACGRGGSSGVAGGDDGIGGAGFKVRVGDGQRTLGFTLRKYKLKQQHKGQYVQNGSDDVVVK